VLLCALFVVVFAGLPAVVLVRSPLLAVPASAAVALTVASLGAIAAAAVGVTVVGVVLAFALVVNLAALLEVIRRFRRGRWAAVFGTDIGYDLGLMAWVTLPAVALLTMFRPRPLAWDARSIWWFHSNWFLRGGDAVRDAIANPAFGWSHPEYPPGAPALTATLWQIAGGPDLPRAQTLTAVLTGLAVAFLAGVLLYESRDAPTIFASMLMVVATVQMGEGLAAHGYVDELCAALLVTALAAFSCIDDSRLAIVAGSLSLASASLVKNEGFVFGIVVVLLAVLGARQARWVVAGAGAAALVPAVLWQGIVRSTGADLDVDVGLGDFVHLFGASARQRFRVAFPEVLGSTWLFVVPAASALALLTVAAWMRAGPNRRTTLLRLRPAALMVGAAVVAVLISACVYAVGDLEITWWLATSLGRVVTIPRLFALASLVSLAGVGSDLLFARPTDRAPDPPVGHAAVRVDDYMGAAS
jgi:hypothetical protein